MKITPGLVGKWALVAAALAVGLVAYGSWVRVSGSGLGCPDWPLCHGKIIPETRSAVIESGHRWFAAITLLAVFFAAFLGFRMRRQFPRGSTLLSLSALLVVVQALLGAAVVLTKLHPMVRLIHLSLALTLIAFLTIAAVGFVERKEPSFRVVRPGWHLLPTAVAVVLLGGSIVASGTSFECHGFPLCDQASSTLGTALHSAHRILGAVLFLAAAFFALRLWRRSGSGAFLTVGVVAAVLLLLQAGIGISLVATRLPVDLRVLHIGTAAAIWWALVGAWTLAAHRVAPGQAARRPARRRGR